jgi:hypothetical protein
MSMNYESYDLSQSDSERNVPYQRSRSASPQRDRSRSASPQPVRSRSASPQREQIYIDEEIKELCKPSHAIYSVFHTIMFFIAIFLSFRCNRGFSFGSFLVACVCPPIYIFYVLITEYDKDLCGLVHPMGKTL